MSGIWESRQSPRHPTYRLVSEPACYPVGGNCSDRLFITSNKNIEIDMHEAIKWPPLVKAFNHLPAATLAADPAVGGGRRVIFVSSDDDAAATPVRALAEQLGFAPVWLGKLAEGGSLVQARDKSWAPLIFQDLFKKGA